MAQRREVARQFIAAGNKVTQTTIKAGVPSSSWFASKNTALIKSTPVRSGRKKPGYSLNPDGTVVLDMAIISALQQYRRQVEFSNAGGYQKLKHYLRRDYGFFVNHKKLYRLCLENNLLLPYRRKKQKRSRRLCQNRSITAPNQLWQFDIKYGYIHGENRFFFLLAFIDVFTRKIVGYHIGLTCKSSDLVFTLDQALINANIKDTDGLAIRSDNGSQMTSHMMRDYWLTCS